MSVPSSTGSRQGPGRIAGRRILVSAALGVLVTACAPVGSPEFWGRLPMSHAEVQAEIDAAAEALRMGNYTTAEVSLQRALYFEPRNPYALLTAGMLYKETNRPTRARQAFEDVLGLSQAVPVFGKVWGLPEADTVQDVARHELRMLDGAGIGGVPPQSSMAGMAGTGQGFAMPLGTVPAVRAEGGALMGDAPAPTGRLDGGIGAAAERFHILGRLQDEGLITPEEYRSRRQANIGALLPLSQPRPAAGLDRPVSEAEAIADRLRQLQQAYEARYISAAQRAAEREIILDSLLPADPLARAPEAVPPDSVVEIAAAVGRLERLRELGLITEAERRAERARLEALLKPMTPAAQSAPVKPRAPAATPKPTPKPNGGGQGGGAAGGGGGSAPMREVGSDAQALADAARNRPPRLLVPDGAGNPAAVLRSGRTSGETVPYRASGETAGQAGDSAGVSDGAGASMAPAATAGPVGAAHLASFRSEERALAGWQELLRRYPSLAAYAPRVTQVNLAGRGTYFRLHAAPFPGLEQARAFCNGLQGQYCDAVVLQP